MTKPKLEVHVNDGPGDPEIPKPPEKISLARFKSGNLATTAMVDVVQTALPVHRLCEAQDFCRLHPTLWSEELVFVNVPIKGAPRDTVHLIDQELAIRYLKGRRRLYLHRLALATKPFDNFFLCIVPSQNLDNIWNLSNLQGCELARTEWIESISLKSEGKEGYRNTPAPSVNAFPDPNWPKVESVDDIIITTYQGRMILSPDSPALGRLCATGNMFEQR